MNGFDYQETEKEYQDKCQHDYRIQTGSDVFRCVKCGKLQEYQSSKNYSKYDY